MRKDGINIDKSKSNTVQNQEKLPLNSDIVFKRVFAKEENKDLLISLLEAILKIEIKSIEIKNPEIPRNLMDSKAGVLDIKAIINDNSVVDVEMQMNDEHNIEHRGSYYMTSISSEEIKKGELYIDLKKTIVIGLLNFNYFKRNGYMHTAHMKFEKGDPETYVNMGYEEEEELATDDLEMIFIELPKFIKKNPDANNSLYQWLWLLAGREDKVKMAKKELKEVKKAMEVIDEMSADPKEWEMYESRRKAIINYNSGMETARREGVAAGLKEGEKKAKEETAKKMIKLKMPIEQIMEISGLSKEEIEKLKNNK